VTLRIAQLDTTGLVGGQRFLGAVADELAFLLRHQCHDIHRHPVSMGHVDRD
jgi:hypothetical protein